MIEAVKTSIDNKKPALVWHAFTMEEFDVVCGYDDDAKQFIGRGTHKGNDEYAREAWDRAKTSNVWGFGAIVIGEKVSDFNAKEAEISSIVGAVRHARKEMEGVEDWEKEGIQWYRKWAEDYSKEGRERSLADAYCYDVYSSVRKAAVVYLHEIAYKYDGAVSDFFHYAAASFEREADEVEKVRPYLSWDSPWGIDEERSKNLAPILKAAAQHYEKGIEYLEKILKTLDIEV